MINYPEYAQVGEIKYKIDTDFRTALKCNEIAEKNDISDEERSLAIIYLLFGEKSLKSPNNWNDLLKIAIKYLKCGKEIEENNKEEVNMDFQQDWGYIQASFFSDYNIDLSKTKIHWWLFYDLMTGLTDKCVLNRVRFVRDFDVSKIKDPKEKQEWIKQKKQVALKKKQKTTEKTERQKKIDKLFINLIKKR